MLLLNERLCLSGGFMCSSSEKYLQGEIPAVDTHHSLASSVLPPQTFLHCSSDFRTHTSIWATWTSAFSCYAHFLPAPGRLSYLLTNGLSPKALREFRHHLPHPVPPAGL